MQFPSRRAVVFALGLIALAACSSGSSVPAPGGAVTTQGQIAGLQTKINNIIVLYLENWSFDALYSTYPGANTDLGSVINQVQYGTVGANGTCSNPSYVPMTSMSQQPLYGATANLNPWPCGWVGSNGVFSVAAAGGSSPDPALSGVFANGGGLPVQSYDLNKYDSTGTLTGDITHVFWHQQMQIDNGVLEPSNGTMDKFVIYSSNPGYVLSYYDGTSMIEGRIAQHYTMADNFFHSAFGGSFLNHQWLICACTPVWNQAQPTSKASFWSYWTPATKTLNDGNVTLMPTPQNTAGAQGGTYYVVNTTQTANIPHGTTTSADQLLAPIPPTTKTIGDLLTDASPSISWKWYSGDWNLAVQETSNAATACSSPPTGPNTNNPPSSGDCFQYHHQPFAYYQRWGSTTTAAALTNPHLQDEQNYFSDLQNGTLPTVSFIKPVGVYNDHPNYSEILAGQLHEQSIIAALCNSKYWANTVLIVTYDENGGRYDHVTPPKIDQWGPGTRVPAIIISPYARPGYVDHTQYETVSILALIEKRFGLSSLGTRDAAANPLLNAFNFSQAPLACQSS